MTNPKWGDPLPYRMGLGISASLLWLINARSQGRSVATTLDLITYKRSLRDKLILFIHKEYT